MMSEKKNAKIWRELWDLAMRREGVAKVLGVPADEIVVSTMRADGDCFYASVSAALAGFGAEPQSIVQLRGLVAEEIGQEQLDMMTACNMAGIEGYEHVLGVDLAGLKASLKRIATDKGGCIWADDFAVQTLSRKLGICFLILNEGAGRGGSLLAIHPGNDSESDPQCCLLQRTRRVHYNLIQVQGRTMLPTSLLPPNISQAFGIAPGTPVVKAAGAGSKRKLAMGVVVFHHDECQSHVTSRGAEVHQEGPDRTELTLRALQNAAKGKGRLRGLRFSSDFARAPREWLERAHEGAYLDLLEAQTARLESLVEQDAQGLTPLVVASGILGPAGDALRGRPSMTPFSLGTYGAALRAAGAACRGVDAVITGDAESAFCCVRPPGHHAGPLGVDTGAGGSGFCVVNGAAVAALHALREHGGVVKKVAIVDFDVHHGNGTEGIVERLGAGGGVLYASTHLYETFPGTGGDEDFFPGTGKASLLPRAAEGVSAGGEGDVLAPRGESGGVGGVFNVPLEPLWAGVGRGGRLAFREGMKRVERRVEEFGPDLVVVSAGFDGAEGDEGNVVDGRGGSDLTPGDYSWATRLVKELAERLCGGRVVSILEGGYGRWDVEAEVYDRDSLVKCCVAHVTALQG